MENLVNNQELLSLVIDSFIFCILNMLFRDDIVRRN